MDGRFRPAAGCRRRRGLSRPSWNYGKIMMIFLVGLLGGNVGKTLEIKGFFRKTGTPPASGAGGVQGSERETDDDSGS